MKIKLTNQHVFIVNQHKAANKRTYKRYYHWPRYETKNVDLCYFLQNFPKPFYKLHINKLNFGFTKYEIFRQGVDNATKLQLRCREIAGYET